MNETYAKRVKTFPTGRAFCIRRESGMHYASAHFFGHMTPDEWGLLMYKHVITICNSSGLDGISQSLAHHLY